MQTKSPLKDARGSGPGLVLECSIRAGFIIVLFLINFSRLSLKSHYLPVDYQYLRNHSTVITRYIFLAAVPGHSGGAF